MIDVDNTELVKLLREAYIYIGMPHKRHDPWRKSLDEWKLRVEKETGWNHFNELEKYKEDEEG